MDGVTFLAFCEAVLREHPKAAEALDDLYAKSAQQTPAPVADPEAARIQRNAEIRRATALFGG